MEERILKMQMALSSILTHWVMALDFRIEQKQYEIEVRNKTFPKEWFTEEE